MFWLIQIVRRLKLIEFEINTINKNYMDGVNECVLSFLRSQINNRINL